MAVTNERDISTADEPSTERAPALPTVTQSLNQSHGSFELVVSPLVLGLLGWWIDGRAGTGPWLAIALATLGVVGAAIKVFYEYRERMAAVAADAQAAAELRAEANRAKVAERERARAELDAELAANLEAVETREPVEVVAR